MVPTSQILLVVKQMEQIFLFFASSMQEGKKFIYPVKVSTPIWSHNEYWNREKKKRDRNSGLFFFLVPWENAESSFEDSVVKKNNEEY